MKTPAVNVSGLRWQRISDRQLSDIEQAASAGDYGRDGNEIQDVADEVRKLRAAIARCESVVVAAQAWAEYQRTKISRLQVLVDQDLYQAVVALGEQP